MDGLLLEIPIAENDKEILENLLTKPETSSPPLESLSETAAKVLFELAINKWQYASAASQLCSCLIHKENKYQSDNPKRHFRTITLQLLQQNFKKRTELRKEEGKFLGLVSYIAGLYRLVRVNDQELTILAVPLYECLNELSAIGSTETEISCLMSQLQLIGQQLEKHSYEKMNGLFISIRNCFLGKNTTPLARRILLEMIEVRAGKWCLSKAAYEYYYCHKITVADENQNVSGSEQKNNANGFDAEAELTAHLRGRRLKASLEKDVL